VEFFPIGERASEQLRKVQSSEGYFGCAGRLFGSNTDIADDGCFRWRDKSQKKAEN